MITKAQAMILKHGDIIILTDDSRWKINGKIKIWKSKTRSHEFKIPVKHGLYSFGYLTHDNAHLFELGD